MCREHFISQASLEGPACASKPLEWKQAQFILSYNHRKQQMTSKCKEEVLNTNVITMDYIKEETKEEKVIV